MIASPENLASLGVDVEHHFGGGAYIKATKIPAGTLLGQHKHDDHDHLSVLVSGRARVYEDGVPREVDGYRTLLLKAGVQHDVEAVTDCIWLCVWATDDTDPSTVDSTILKG